MSPGFEILELLLAYGAEVEYSDPYIPVLPAMRRWPHRPLTDEYLAMRDCVVVVTDHSAYDWERIVRNAPMIIDTRNATRPWHSQ